MFVAFIMFSWRNKENISNVWLKKVPYLELCTTYVFLEKYQYIFIEEKKGALMAPYSSKIDIFIRERFNKLILKYDHKMWHLTACKISVTVNVLKFRTLYSLLFWPKFCLLCTCFLKYLVEWQTV